ncbi:MAG: aldo/keto reductase [Aeromonadaceae bacterium]
MRLALGTVQFGLAYGVSNQEGKVSESELSAILTLARQLGIDTLDTAQAYSDAEQRLGAQETADFSVVNKLAPGVQAAQVSQLIEGSLQQLKRSRLDGLLLHRSQDAAPELFSALQEQQQAGRVGKLGVSVYSPEELEQWLAQGYPLQLVQLPANLLDQRFLRSGWLDRLEALGCEIHVRSLFLQGLLLMAPEQRPKQFQAFNQTLARLDSWRPHMAPLNKALSLITALPQVSRFVVGVCHAHELAAIAASYQHLHSLPDSELAFLASSEPQLINPGLWSPS